MKDRLVLYWILLRSLFVIIYYCSLAFLTMVFGIGSRQRTDGYMRAFGKKLLDIIKLDYKIFNPYQVKFTPGKSYMVLCNHASLYDIPLSIVAIDGSMRMVAKKELVRIPIFGPAMKKNEFILIDRKNRQQAIKDLQEAKEKMHSGIIIWMAPEGTRSRDGNLLPFKKGPFVLAIESGATIIPLGIRGATHIMPHKTFKINQGRRVEVHFGKPIDASHYVMEKRSELMQEVEMALREATDLKN